MGTKKNKSQYKPRNYFALPHAIIDNPDYFNMTFASQCLLTAFGRLYNGFNNGDLSIPHSEMKIKGWPAAKTLSRAKDELLAFDWLRLTRQGNKYGFCNLYALSWIPLDHDKKMDIQPGEFILRCPKKVIGTW